MVVFVRPAAPPSAASSALRFAVLSGTPRNGIVTVYFSPVSGFPVIGPSYGGKADELFSMTTAAAPAFCPKTARATRAQVPRRVTTSFPATFAFVYSAGSQPSEIVVGFDLRTTTWSV